MTLKLNGTNSEAAPAYAGDDADTGLQCGTNELKLVTGGSARATVDSSGNVGIGGAPTVFGGQNYLTIHSPGASTNIAGVDFKVSGTREASIISYPSNSEALRIAGITNRPVTFHANNTERMRILSSGGITFNGDTATANALEDYEEGTFTPADASGAGLTFTNNTGVYTKIGNTVFAYVRFFMPTTTNGTIHSVGGFPFNNSLANAFSGGYIHYGGAGIDVNYRRGTATSFMATRDGGATQVTNANLSGKEIQATFIYGVS